MKNYLLCAFLALGVSCATPEEPIPVKEVIEILEEEISEVKREYFHLDPDALGDGWLLAQGYGGDSLLVQYTYGVDSTIYSPDYLYVPDTIEVLRNDLNSFEFRVRWDMNEYGSDTTWIKTYVIDWSDSTYSWASSILNDGYQYPDEVIEDLKLQAI